MCFTEEINQFLVRFNTSFGVAIEIGLCARIVKGMSTVGILVANGNRKSKVPVRTIRSTQVLERVCEKSSPVIIVSVTSPVPTSAGKFRRLSRVVERRTPWRLINSSEAQTYERNIFVKL